MLSHSELAQKVVDEQPINNSFLRAVTGLGAAITLPVIIPSDIIKSWKIQDFPIKCIAEGYTPQTADIKTASMLLMPSGSIKGIKQLVIEETAKAVNQYTLNTVDTLKKSAIQIATIARCATSQHFASLFATIYLFMRECVTFKLFESLQFAL